MTYITALDYILLPLYLALFYALVRKMSNKYTEDLKKIMLIAFGLRMLGSIGYAMLVQYYYGYGDSFTYYNGGEFFTNQIHSDLSNVSYLFSSYKEATDWYNSIEGDVMMGGYFATPANNLVMRISAVISFLAFHKFLIISLFFGLFSFLGQWKLFLVFDDINKHRNRKLMAFAILYSPSIWFWGSGLMKDPICLGALGLIIHILYQFFAKRKFSIRNLVFLFALIYVITTVKSYITSILMISIAVMLFSIFLRSIKNTVFRYTLLFVMLGLTGLIVYTSDFSSELTKIAEESVAQIEEFKTNYQATLQEEGSKGGFTSTKQIDPSFSGLLLNSPGVIFSCLFRPFLWESSKLIILFTSLESMILLGCTIYLMIKMGIIRFFRIIFKTPFLLFCFIMSMLFALVIGYTTFNFGTMIRYKIIFLPLYYYMLVDLYTKYISLEKGKLLPVTINKQEGVNVKL